MNLALFFSAFALSLLCSFGVLVLFPKWGLMDRPERYGYKRNPIPYPGGVALYLGFLASALVFLPKIEAVWGIIAGASLLAFTSFIDDRRGLSPILRLLVQFGAAGLLIYSGISIATVSLPVLGSVGLGAWHVLVTLVWVIVMVNAFNWTDGVQGLSSGMGIVVSLILLLLSMRPDFHSVDQSLAIELSLMVLGVSLGFFFFNFPPAKMLMGDTGSMLLGFLLAAAALVSGAKIATTVLVLSFPLLDFVWVIGRRIVNGQSPFKGDLMHFHHRLLNIGFSERKVVVFFMASASAFGALALMLETLGKVLAFGGITGFMVLLAALLYARK